MITLLRGLTVLGILNFLIYAYTPMMANAQSIQMSSIQKKLAALEAASGGRLGLSAIDTANNNQIQYRADERFPFCSTGKVMAVSAILKKSEKDPSILRKQITYTQVDVNKSGYAPITQQHIKGGMNVGDLCQAALDYSDNNAMNLLMKTLGGPKAVTAYARSIHDDTFRLDRFEPELNTAIPKDHRDTTTPNAMVNSLKQLTLGDSLELPQQKLLQTWLKNNTTGDTKIRAGTPKDWLIGDKTGNGSYGTTNDIAVIWPPQCSPIVLVIYLTQKEKNAVKYDEVIASATRLVLHELAKTNQCVKGEMDIKKLR